MEDTKQPAGALCSNAGLGPLPERWYVLTTEGLATLCATEADARAVKAHADVAFRLHGPHRVALLGDVAAERERCAKLCEEVESQAWALWKTTADPIEQGRNIGAQHCADAIRA